MLGPSRSHRKRPVRLDRRRLDKAVTLAVEAAQIAEEDELARQQRERRRQVRADAEAAFRALPAAQADDAPKDGILSRIRTISDISSLTDGYTRPRLSSLKSWSGRAASRRHQEELPMHQGEASTRDVAFGSSEESEVSNANSDESEEDADNFSLSLYLSAVSYLLSALPAHETPHLPSKERQELKSKLESMLQDLGYNDASTSDGLLLSSVDGNAAISTAEAQREERLREMLETELRRAEARMLGGATSSSASTTRPSPSKPRSRTLSAARENPRSTRTGGNLAATIAYSTLELTFAVAAAGVGVLGSGLAMLAPAAAQADTDAANKVVPAIEPSSSPNEKTLLGASASSQAPRSGTGRPPSSSGALGSKLDDPSAHDSSARTLQWNLAMALASTTASTLYGCLSAAAAETASEERRLSRMRDRSGKEASQAGATTALVPSEKSLAAQGQLGSSALGEEGMVETEMTEDRLILLTASFARALRRSPLPSQVSSLTTQLKSLLQAIDEKYAVRRRAADEALRRTRQGLGYVRKKGWHVTIVRGLWAMMEMGVAGIEAWREEGAEQVDAGKWADQEGVRSPMVITASA